MRRSGRSRGIRSAAALTSVLVLAAALAGCGGSGAASSGPSQHGQTAAPAAFHPQTETIIVTASAGGGLDTIIRQLQPYLSQTLGSPVSVVDMPGGQSAVGASGLLNHGASCSYMMISGVPQILYTFATQKLPFAWSSFYPVASLTAEPTGIAVQATAPWKSLGALVAYAKSHPRAIRASVSQYASPDYVTLYQIEQATSAKFDVVQFNGGGPARAALLGGQVQVTAAPVFGLSALGKKVRVLAVAATTNRWGSITGNAPTVTGALGATIPPSVAYYGLWATQACHAQHPAEYQALVSAVQAATQVAGFRSVLQKAHSLDSLDVTAGPAFQTQIQAQQDQITQLLKADPKLFSGL